MFCVLPRPIIEVYRGRDNVGAGVCLLQENSGKSAQQPIYCRIVAVDLDVSPEARERPGRAGRSIRWGAQDGNDQGEG